VDFFTIFPELFLCRQNNKDSSTVEYYNNNNCKHLGFFLSFFLSFSFFSPPCLSLRFSFGFSFSFSFSGGGSLTGEGFYFYFYLFIILLVLEVFSENGWEGVGFHEQSAYLREGGELS
jgi:hypothetical protein